MLHDLQQIIKVLIGIITLNYIFQPHTTASDNRMENLRFKLCSFAISNIILSCADFKAVTSLFSRLKQQDSAPDVFDESFCVEPKTQKAPDG